MMGESESTQYAQVLIDLDAKALDRRTFTYAIPAEMREVIQIGVPVSVPFGRMKVVTGFIVGFTNYLAPGIKAKEIVDILDDLPLFDLDYLQFLDWLATYTATPLMTVVAAALPSSMVQKSRRTVKLLSQVGHHTRPRHVQKILETLSQRALEKPVGVRYIVRETHLPLKQVNQVLYALQAEGVVELETHHKGAQKQRTRKWLRLMTPPAEVSVSSRQAKVIEALASLSASTTESEMILSEAAKSAMTTTATLEKLAEKGVVEIFEAPLNRDENPVAFYKKQSKTDYTLNDEQQSAVDSVIAAPPGEWFQVYGVTGSGKTEVYLALAEYALAQQQSVLVLVPEISLTSHLARRFVERFGNEQVILWHSHLSAGEKTDAWRRLREGATRIVIGARSAIFTPLSSLGIIIMDESHDGAFKQESPAPRYHARILAQELIKRTGAKLVLGSATPDVETHYVAKKENRLLTLSKRFGGRSLADVKVVDMREAREEGHRGTLSPALLESLNHTISKGHQAILLLNRRGFFTLIMCMQCDEIVGCPHCDVALTFHQARQQAQCHYCGYEVTKPKHCSHCASSKLIFTGFGTQRLEEELQTAIPNARLLRLDSDVMQKKHAHREILEAFNRHEADILIGTQMVAKGLDIPNVTLVGVVGADLAFSLPDFKAAERGFQLLTQVAGRSGRGDHEGHVMIQTMQPDHPVILRAQDQDYLGFYKDEIAKRAEFEFPPYSQLFRMLASSQDEFQTQHFLKAVVSNLLQSLDEQKLIDAVRVLGPAACVISRIRGYWRYQVMIKNLAGQRGHDMLTKFYQSIRPPEGMQFVLDVDCQSFL